MSHSPFGGSPTYGEKYGILTLCIGSLEVPYFRRRTVATLEFVNYLKLVYVRILLAV